MVERADAGEEAAELPGAISGTPGWMWLTLGPVAGLSLSASRAESWGLSEEWVAGEPDVEVEVGVWLGLWWLAAVEPLPCGWSLSLVKGAPEVAVCTEEEAGEEAE